MAKKSKTHECEGCGKKLSKSGYYKHRKNCEAYAAHKQETPKTAPYKPVEPVHFSPPTHESPEPLESTEEDLSGNKENITIEEDERPDWFDFDVGQEEGVTEQFPTALKWAAGGATEELGNHPSKAQIQDMHDTNIQILVGALGGVDILIQTYGRAVTLDKELTVKHSSSDKEMVAHAQYNWLLSKGINPSDFVSTGTIAAALTGYFIIPPVIKIRKKAQRRFFRSGKISGFLSRIPLIGRFFKKKSVVPESVMREQVTP